MLNLAELSSLKITPYKNYLGPDEYIESVPYIDKFLLLHTPVGLIEKSEVYETDHEGDIQEPEFDLNDILESFGTSTDFLLFHDLVVADVDVPGQIVQLHTDVLFFFFTHLRSLFLS